MGLKVSDKIKAIIDDIESLKQSVIFEERSLELLIPPFIVAERAIKICKKYLVEE